MVRNQQLSGAACQMGIASRKRSREVNPRVAARRGAALLMVSRIRYTSFKGGSGPKSDRVPFFALLIAVAVLVALVIDPPRVLLAAAALYALSGPLLWIRRRRQPVERA